MVGSVLSRSDMKAVKVGGQLEFSLGSVTNYKWFSWSLRAQPGISQRLCATCAYAANTSLKMNACG